MNQFKVIYFDYGNALREEVVTLVHWSEFTTLWEIPLNYVVSIKPVPVITKDKDA
jgi:hypothetical protein